MFPFVCMPSFQLADGPLPSALLSQSTSRESNLKQALVYWNELRLPGYRKPNPTSVSGMSVGIEKLIRARNGVLHRKSIAYMEMGLETGSGRARS